MAAEVTTINVERTIVSTASTIFLIDCLDEGEKQSARTRHEGICDTLLSFSSQKIMHDISQVYHERCKHRGDWITVMNKIRDLSKLGLFPLVFIDGHGDPERGLKMPAGDFISWHQYGQDLRAIIYAARGELTVIAAFCHSYSFIEKSIKLGTKLPFAFYFGYEGIVKTSVVDQETEIIYNSLLRDGGKSLDFDQFQISRYDEYDHAINLVAPVVMMQIAPKTLVTMLPEFSKKQLRAKLEQELTQQGIRLGNLRRAITEALRNTNKLSASLIESTMHDTDRRRRFIKQIHSEMKKHSGHTER